MNASDSTAAPSLLRSRLILLTVCAVLLPSCAALAQTANLNYTADLPSVARVKAEIKGSDPTDTLARQAAIFTYLPVYIERIKYNRTVRGPYTPEEQRLIAEYQLAAYQISQDYAKAHTPDEAKAFERLHGQYEMNSDFYKDWSHRLIGPQSAAAYKNMETEMGARQQAHVAEQRRTYDEAHAKTTNGQGLSNDPTAVATRRCLELGGSPIACMGKGMGAGFMDMIGFHPEDLTGPGRAGVVLSGTYKNPATTTSLDFGPDVVSIAGCGKLVADGHAYTIEKRPGSLRVHVNNEPQPLVLTMRPDGGLTGPGPIDVKGRIIIGYHIVTHTLYVNGAPAVGSQCAGPCQTSESVPDYAPKVERCTIASLAMPPRPKPEAQPAAGESGLMGMLTGVFNTGEMNIPTEPGLRMTGQFSSGKLLLDFTPTSIILDCGEAHVRGAYNVENATDQLLVHVENPGGAFALAVEPDNSLRGTGSTTVNGRLVSGMQGDNVTFTPHAKTCEVASFRPKTGSSATGSTTKVAANSPPPSAATPTALATTSAAPAPVAYAAPTTTTPSLSTAVPSAATPSTATRADMRVLITSNFAASANPLAGQTIYIMRERMDDVLRKLGAPIPANTSPAQAWRAFATACQGQGVDCTPVLTALKSHFVTAAKLDAAGKATLSATATTGAYFLFAQARSSEGLMVWDLPENFVAGDNSITLTAANAEHLK
jgi:hypothetical protein